MSENPGAKRGRSGSRRRAAGAKDEAPAPSFEAALGRLEEIVGKLEGGTLGLEESLELFEEGVRLSRFCQSKLAAVERRVEVVLEGKGGKIRTEPLDVETGEREEDGDTDLEADDGDGDDGGR